MVDAFLGSGGLGAVYAVENSYTGGTFALKISRFDVEELPPEDREREAQRLVREFNTLQALAPHDCIVPVYAFGWHEGTPYFTMENLNGCSLDKYMEDVQPHMHHV